jgi:hypothetical protein
MLKWFWIITAMVGVLWYMNTRYAIQEYLASRNKALLITFLVFLTGLGYFAVHVTARLLTLAMASQEIVSFQ